MKKILFLLVATGLLACNADRTEKKIRVVGEGKVRVLPDQVILTINVSFTEPRMVDAVRKTQQTVDSVVAVMKAYNNDSKDIKIASISANKDYQYVGNTNKFVGYNAQQNIDFVLKDLKRFTPLTGALLSKKISAISQIQFGHSKADSLYREADLLAYDDALKSAKQLCKRADVSLGKLLLISNVPPRTENDDYNYNRLETFAKGYGGEGFKISPQVLEFKRTVSSEFAIN